MKRQSSVGNSAAQPPCEVQLPGVACKPGTLKPHHSFELPRFDSNIYLNYKPTQTRDQILRNFLIATAFTRIESTSLPSADREREQFSWIRTPPTNKRLIQRQESYHSRCLDSSQLSSLEAPSRRIFLLRLEMLGKFLFRVISVAKGRVESKTAKLERVLERYRSQGRQQSLSIFEYKLQFNIRK